MRRALGPLLAAIALTGCGSSNSSHSVTASHPSATTSTTAAASGGCRQVATPPSKGVPQLKPPSYKLDPRRVYTVTIATNCGAFAFTLDVKQSPKTSASFYALVKRGFFDDTIFHRVVPGFVIQGGDPTGAGTGGPGYTVVEPPPRATQYVFGDVAMARSQSQPSGASGSQFFIVTAANATQSAGLTPTYALLGKLVSGQHAVTTIGKLPTNADEMPTPTVVMAKVTVAVSR
ncbi:MAG TPA: peptidylprolyl isomerase [Solirubrobacteraceae bacterium]|nr:peptidylprolyl isomerase [Solirubrobacteraceae bacterium]